MFAVGLLGLTSSSCLKKQEDFVKINSVEYISSQSEKEAPMIIIGTEGYDNELPEKVHYYVDENYIFSWNTPKSFDRNGKRIEEKGLGSIKYMVVCLPHEKGESELR